MNNTLLEKYSNKKKRSKLLPFIKDITLLLEHDATQASILEYLKIEQNVTVSQPVLSTFIKRYIAKNPLSKKSKKVISKKQAQEEIETPPAKETSKKKEDSIFL
jgi:hypothetical protein